MPWEARVLSWQNCQQSVGVRLITHYNYICSNCKNNSVGLSFFIFIHKKSSEVTELLEDSCNIKDKICWFAIYWGILTPLQSIMVHVSVNTKKFLKTINCFHIFSLLVVITYESKRTWKYTGKNKIIGENTYFKTKLTVMSHSLPNSFLKKYVLQISKSMLYLLGKTNSPSTHL